MPERDSKRILRQWDREIEDETRRLPRGERGPWRIVVWVALWCLWLALLVAIAGLIRPLHW